MGFRTVAIARGPEKRALAEQLGAHEYLDASSVNAAEALKKMGGADAILSTATNGRAMAELIPGLAPTGKLLVVSVPQDPIPVMAYDLVFGGRAIQGSLTGKVIDGQDALAFSALHGVRAMVETSPLAQAPAAYERMMRGEPRFRAVLVMENKEN
jgi:propanol-preferring alcohol dehydrogenase